MVADHDHVLGARSHKPSAATPRPSPPQHARSYLVGGKLPRGWREPRCNSASTANFGVSYMI